MVSESVKSPKKVKVCEHKNQISVVNSTETLYRCEDCKMLIPKYEN